MQSALHEAHAFTYLALGDSYTVAESLSPQDSYPEIVAGRLRTRGWHVADPLVLATTGWTTANLLSAMDRKQWKGQRFDWVSLLIGVNNQYQGESFPYTAPNAPNW